MNRLLWFIALAVAGLNFTGITGAPAPTQTSKILWAAEELKWEPASKLPGVMVAGLRGDRRKGAYEEFVKFPAGYKGQLHSHTYDQKIVVVKGAYILDGKKYGPGSYLFIPGGERHGGGGDPDSETIFYQEQPGRFDLNLDEPLKEMR